MTLQLPETFHLPDGETYDHLISELDEEIAQEGSASLYLGMIRSKRRYSESFGKVLRNQALVGLIMEARDEEGHLRDTTHKIANTALSGMVFGHFLNEKHYPYIGAGIYPYDVMPIKISFLGDYMARYVELGAHQTVEGKRLGFSAMAETQLSKLSEESARTVHKWAQETILDPTIRTNFTFGVGLSLYQAWLTYHDVLGEQREIVESEEGDELIQNNRGDGTSI